MQTATIQEAADATGWSPRMLRYLEQLGLVTAPRSASGYRLYGPVQLHRLRTLRDLLDRHSLELGEIGFALRLRGDAELAADLTSWFDAGQPAPGQPTPEPSVRAEAGSPDAGDWLSFEQDKHQQLLRQ